MIPYPALAVLCIAPHGQLFPGRGGHAAGKSALIRQVKPCGHSVQEQSFPGPVCESILSPYLFLRKIPTIFWKKFFLSRTLLRISPMVTSAWEL